MLTNLILALIAAAYGGALLGLVIGKGRRWLNWRITPVLILSCVALLCDVVAAMSGPPWVGHTGILAVGAAGLLSVGLVIEDVIFGRRRRIRALKKAPRVSLDDIDTADAQIGEHPCPFCGGEAGLFVKGLYPHHDPNLPDSFAYYGLCGQCSARGGWSGTPEGAARYWTRLESLQEVRAALAKDLPRMDRV